jgi:uncharacterized protein involved in exopolysaccharide biosynthesis
VSTASDPLTDGGAPPGTAAPNTGDLSALGVLAVLVRHWRALVFVPLALGVLTGALSYLIKPTFVSAIAFVPEAEKGLNLPAALGGLADQLGIRVPTVGAERSPQFYAVLAKSRDVMDSLLLTRYPAADAGVAGDSVQLLALLVPRPYSLPERLYRGREKLGDRLSASIDIETNIVRARVGMPTPQLAADVAARLFREINDFNLEKRQVTARARRRFVEQRVAEAQETLRRSEDDLRNFLVHNRRYETSPELMVEQQRLNRAVQVRQEVYLTLARDLENSRIEEVNDTPTLTLIEPPRAPVRKSKPRRVLMVVAALLLGLAGTLGVIAVGEYRAALARRNAPDLLALRGALREARRQATGIFHRARR